MSSISGIVKKNVVFYMSAEEATLRKMPKMNGFQTGHGIHGDRKYNRTKSKRRWRKELNESNL